MVRNRESALQSRLRKKVYTEELEGRVRDLVRANGDLEGKVVDLLRVKGELEGRNRRLEEENGQLRRALAAGSGSNMNGSFAPFGSNAYGNPLRASGLITFVVLFSFGFMYHFGVSISHFIFCTISKYYFVRLPRSVLLSRSSPPRLHRPQSPIL